MPQKTPLDALHRERGARIVDFAGWAMPLHYGSQIDEHHAVRRDAGMFDVSHMRVVDVRGALAGEFLREALANDVGKLKEPGHALYSCLLNDDGGVLDDLIVYFVADDFYRIVVNAATAHKDLAWLLRLRDRLAPELSIHERDDLAMIAVQGPNACAKVWKALPGTEAATAALKRFSAAQVGERFIARTGYTGEDGFEIVTPVAHAAADWRALEAASVVPCGLGARDTLRLEAGMNLYGQDMDERTGPFESGLAWTVDLSTPRDFVGRAALEVAPRERQLVGLVLDGGGVLRAHQKVRTVRGDGETTSGTFSPTLGRSIALARVPSGIAPGDTVDVEIRGKWLPAKVVRPPFVRHGKPLV